MSHTHRTTLCPARVSVLMLLLLAFVLLGFAAEVRAQRTTRAQAFEITPRGGINLNTTPDSDVTVSSALGWRCQTIAPPVSEIGKARIYADCTTGVLRVSYNGGAYVNLTAGGSGGGGAAIPGTFARGDLVYAANSSTLVRLPAPTGTGRKYLTSAGDGTNGAPPVWRDLDLADVTGVLPALKGGTGLSTIGVPGSLLTVNNFGTGLIYRPLLPGNNVTITDTGSGFRIDAAATFGSRWSALAPPTANSYLTHQNYTTRFEWGNATGANDLFTIADSASNTGTGYLFNVNSAAGSSVRPARLAANGNGVELTSAGVLRAVGSGTIQATTAQNAQNAVNAQSSQTAVSAQTAQTATTAQSLTGLLSVPNGGTGATNAAAARANLGAVSRTGDTLAGIYSADVVAPGNVTGFDYRLRGDGGAAGTETIAIAGRAQSANDSDTRATGVLGVATTNASSSTLGYAYGVRGRTEGGFNVRGFAIYGEAGPNNGGNNSQHYAARFVGDVEITGTMTAASKNFVIDHPRPNKADDTNLVYAAVEAPRLDVLLRGRGTLAAGTVTVSLDVASNQSNGTYQRLAQNNQCWAQNETSFTPVRCSVNGGQITITAQDAASTDTVSFLVLGERADDYVKAQHNLHPEGYDAQGRLKPEQPKQVVSAATAAQLSELETETVDSNAPAADRFEDRVVSELVGTRGYKLHAAITGGRQPTRRVRIRTRDRNAPAAAPAPNITPANN